MRTASLQREKENDMEIVRGSRAAGRVRESRKTPEIQRLSERTRATPHRTHRLIDARDIFVVIHDVSDATRLLNSRRVNDAGFEFGSPTARAKSPDLGFR